MVILGIWVSTPHSSYISTRWCPPVAGWCITRIHCRVANNKYHLSNSPIQNLINESSWNSSIQITKSIQIPSFFPPKCIEIPAKMVHDYHENRRNSGHRAALDATLATSEAQAAEAIEAWPEMYLSPAPNPGRLIPTWLDHLYRVNVGICWYMLVYVIVCVGEYFSTMVSGSGQVGFIDWRTFPRILKIQTRGRDFSTRKPRGWRDLPQEQCTGNSKCKIGGQEEKMGRYGSSQRKMETAGSTRARWDIRGALFKFICHWNRYRLGYCCQFSDTPKIPPQLLSIVGGFRPFWLNSNNSLPSKFLIINSL